MSQGWVISDLHLFSRRSDGAGLWKDAAVRFAEVDTLVLNGDIFDFRWSQLGDETTSIKAAVKWIEELLANSTWSTIHYILGNHDCLIEFRSRLQGLAESSKRFQYHEQRLQLGRNLFLHGDCANRFMDRAALERSREAWSRDRPRGRMRRALYDGADALGLSRRFHEFYFPTGRSVRRIAHHLAHVMPSWREDLDDCFFGHTHRPFTGFRLNGVRFHNTGSGIRGMGFQPLPFDCQARKTETETCHV